MLKEKKKKKKKEIKETDYMASVSAGFAWPKPKVHILYV